MEKKEARQRARQLWEQTLADRSVVERLIEGLAQFLERISPESRLVAFLPLPDEPDIRPILESWSGSLFLPRLSYGPVMEFRQIAPSALSKLEEGPHGIRQPPGTAPLLPLPLSEQDCVLIPALGVTRQGFRLGRGGGHYDRSRDQLSAAKMVSLLPSSLLDLEFPVELHDLRLKSVITEAGVVDYI